MDENTSEYTVTEKLIRVIVEASTMAATKAAILSLRHQGIEPTEEEKKAFHEAIFDTVITKMTDPAAKAWMYGHGQAHD